MIKIYQRVIVFIFVTELVCGLPQLPADNKLENELTQTHPTSLLPDDILSTESLTTLTVTTPTEPTTDSSTIGDLTTDRTNDGFSEYTTLRMASVRQLKFTDNNSNNNNEEDTQKAETSMWIAEGNDYEDEILENDYNIDQFDQSQVHIMKTLDSGTSVVDETTMTNELANDSDSDPVADNLDETLLEQTSNTQDAVEATNKVRVLKLTPDQILKNLINDRHLRSPIAALVDKKQNPLSKTKLLWKSSLTPNRALEIVLVSYDGEDVKATYHLENTKTLSAALDSIREEIISDDKGPMPSRTYYSIFRAGQLIPYDSAIFLSTDSIPKDEEFKQQASMMLFKKRIRLFLIMFDENLSTQIDSFEQKETNDLAELAIRTGGEVVNVPDTAFKPDGEFDLITFIVKNDLNIQKATPTNVDRTMKSLQPHISAKLQSSTTETPIGDEINQTELEYEIIQTTSQVIGNVTQKLSKQVLLETVTKVDVGAQSQLMIPPGSTGQIFFDVTNLRKEPTFHNFQVQDELRYLRELQPRGFLLAPGETKQVVVTLSIPTNAQLGIRNKITLTSASVTTVQQSVYLTVSSTGVQDPWQPHIWYTYGSRCEWHTGGSSWTSGSCAGHIWSVEIVAQDHESGLMRIESNPKGLVYRGPFIAGTNQQVKATYSASCCEPRVTITAMDINRNQRSLQLDVSEIWLSEFGIATVVLGVLFFILLIILLVIWIRWCVKRRRDSRDLPTYRSGDVRT